MSLKIPIQILLRVKERFDEDFNNLKQWIDNE